MKDKNKLLIIILLVAIVITIIFIYFKNKRNNITFVLNGETSVVVEYGSNYIDPGFIAKDGFNSDISRNVTVTGKVNTYTPGINKIVYELDYNGYKTSLIRIVTVKEIKEDNLKIILNGEEKVYLLKDSKYEEAGAYVLNTLDNNKYEDGNLNITGEVDVAKAGTYDVIYTFTYNGGVITATRKVNVIDILYHISPNTLTPNKVKISLDLDYVNDYVKTILPDGSTITSKNINYEVNSNGSYSFIIVLSNNQEFKEEITINNIVSNYMCSGEITSTGTKISVTPTTNIKEYEWIIDNEVIKGSNMYNQNKSVTDAKVNLVLNDDNKYKVNCNITDKLAYHFKYDENNTKPFMACDTYSTQDKVRLDAMLKQSVNMAGYGTRAGVVEAARFLVGALDYKVPYVGGLAYAKEGLNIGQKNAWGCYKAGLDCYYFIDWAFHQNGKSAGALFSDSSSTRNIVNTLTVGDYLYTPCSGPCQNKYSIQHVGMIIGVDDKFFYVAEATTGSVNATIVTKWEKNNMPKSGKFSRARHYNYPSEGNVTNMWMS